MSDFKSILLLGNAAAGKTTLLTQLHGRLQAGDGLLRMHSAPASLAPIQAALQRLEQGLAVEHTPRMTSVEQTLHAVTDVGRKFDVVLPDYAGETLADIVASRRICPDWQERVRRAGHWVLLLRLSQHSELPDVLNRPVADVRTDTTPEQVTPGAFGLPLDLWAVELLQILLYTRHSGKGPRLLPRLTVALSCWDELAFPDGTAPSRVLTERLPLVASFCVAHWPESILTVVGISAQGQALFKDEEAINFIDAGPQRMGWLVTADGGRDGDLTRLLVDL